jgi:hypothetical protein
VLIVIRGITENDGFGRVQDGVCLPCHDIDWLTLGGQTFPRDSMNLFAIGIPRRPFGKLDKVCLTVPSSIAPADLDGERFAIQRARLEVQENNVHPATGFPHAGNTAKSFISAGPQNRLRLRKAAGVSAIVRSFAALGIASGSTYSGRKHQADGVCPDRTARCSATPTR